MKTLLVGVAAATLQAVLPAAAATAPTVNKTWVSSTGTDSGSCQLVAPCKTFAYAIGETNPGGEIDVKDSGAYGPVEITKSIAIVAADGVLASVGAPDHGTGITITAQSSDKIVLRGLAIDGHNIGQYGIRIASALNVIVDHCTVTDATYGILASNGFVMLTNNLVVGGYEGILVVNSANVYVGGNTLTGSNFGLVGPMRSYGDNKVNGSIECDTCQATISPAPTF